MDTPRTLEIDGVLFEFRPMDFEPIPPADFNVRKPEIAVDRYLELADEFTGSNIFEVGVNLGGGTAFFTKAWSPKTFVAIELVETPVEVLTKFLADHDPENRVSIYWGTDQADQARLGQIAEKHFGSAGIDFLVDDASHLLGPTTATFEALFPRIRPGGLFLIEDWAHDHLAERVFQQHVEEQPDSELAQRLRAAKGQPIPTPLSVLIAQIVVAAGYRPDLIASVRINHEHCEIRRGPAEVAPNTPIAEYLGPRGQQIFDSIGEMTS